MRGEKSRMVPHKDGKANRGHSCVKGRFAWGYTTHKERIPKPMIARTSPIPGAKCRGRGFHLAAANSMAQ
jgi:formate dehydrogenase major subunit